MSTIIQVRDPHNKGKTTSAELVKIRDLEEPFTYATLEDGTTITFRTTILHAARIVDRYDKNGNPIYDINLNASMQMVVPDHLKRKVK